MHNLDKQKTAQGLKTLALIAWTNTMTSHEDKYPIETKWKIFFFVAGVSPLIVMLLYSLTLPTARQELIQDSFTGQLINKYIDSTNHCLRTFTIKKTKDSKSTSLVFVWDTAFFNLIKPGDSLVKIKGGQFFKVCRQDSEFVVPIAFLGD